jgi:hypothetical protein
MPDVEGTNLESRPQSAHGVALYPMTIEYVHEHDCSMKGTPFFYRPEIRQGVALMQEPICVELNVPLNWVGVEGG